MTVCRVVAYSYLGVTVVAVATLVGIHFVIYCVPDFHMKFMEQKFPCLSPFVDKLPECTTCKARISFSNRVALETMTLYVWIVWTERNKNILAIWRLSGSGHL